MNTEVEEIRSEFARNDSIRDEGQKTPDDIERFDDIIYGDDLKWQSLDVYRPKNVEGKLPVIVSVHGGGWIYGDKELYQYYCMRLASYGFVVVNFSYRLAPENPFPAAIEDVNSVFSWVIDHADSYGMDTEALFAVGDSAGAHLLGMYMNICTNEIYRGRFKMQLPEQLEIKAVALNCGVYRITQEEKREIFLNAFLEGDISSNRLELIDVPLHITSAFPPAFVMTSNKDYMKMQTSVLAEKLLQENVPFELHFYGDKEHELSHVFHLDARLKEAEICNSAEILFFKQFLLCAEGR